MSPARRSDLDHDTDDVRQAAVLRVIGAMRHSLDQPQPLTELARVGMFSPFHFHRIFRDVTSVTPARFLASLRMAEAKRLLVHSDQTITQISSGVGYESLGTFTTQFTRLVGVSPGQFRRLASVFVDVPLGELGYLLGPARPPGTGPTLRFSAGPTRDEEIAHRIGFIGVFAGASPQQTPLACALLSGSEQVPLSSMPPDGDHTVQALLADPDATADQALLADRLSGCLVGSVRVRVRHGSTGSAPIQVRLREPAPVDPPVLTVAPLLALTEQAVEAQDRAR